MKRVLCVFGTRPEIIKLAPVLRELESRSERFELIRVSSSQHTQLLHPFAQHFGITIDRDLEVMTKDQTPAEVTSRVVGALDPLLEEARPDLLLVQGDTTTAMAAALAGFFRKIPVGHVEAGLRSGNSSSPFPEEMNRTLITQLTSLHLAATAQNVKNLLAEGVAEASISLTGNPVIDALAYSLAHDQPSANLIAQLAAIDAEKLLVLTTHRRENFGEAMRGNLQVLRDFVEARPDVTLVFPVHPNPEVSEPAREIFRDAPRIHLLSPLAYPDFIHLLSCSWLIVSDSGGIQEEAPSLGKALLVLRENTERPEAIEAGVARLVGSCPETLATVLEALHKDDAWIRSVREATNPFGKGDASKRIVDAIDSFLSAC